MRSTTLLLLGVLSCAHAPALAQDPSEDIERILEKYHVPGAAVALVDRTSIWARGYGKADLASDTPMTAETLCRVASISKSFVAACLLQLRQECRVQRETPLSRLLPEVEIANPWASTDPVRLVHLLEHTAGFDDMRFNEMYAPQDRDPPLLEALAVNPRSRLVRWRPGTRPSYS